MVLIFQESSPPYAAKLAENSTRDPLSQFLVFPFVWLFYGFSSRQEVVMDRRLIEDYVACGPRLRQAVAGLSQEDLTARPGPGDWSILELVIHLADSDAISIDRMKRILTEDEPPLLYANETEYVRRLHAHEQSLEDALNLFEVGRRQFARVLRALPDNAFERRGIHNRRGALTVGGLVEDYIGHVDDHMKFLIGKRARLGKPI
jgi:hypothetical protein